MKEIRWDKEKDAQLLMTRGISFERAAEMIERGEIVATIDGGKAYPHQRIFVLAVEGYAYCVPFVETDIIFLKTIFPNRKATRRYLRGH